MKKISKYPEMIVEFTHLYFNIRVWYFITDLEAFDPKKDTEDLITSLREGLGNFNEMVAIANTIFEVEHVNSVEVKFITSKVGVVLYKNWP